MQDDLPDALPPSTILEYAQSMVAWLTMHDCSPADGSAALSVALGIWIDGMTTVAQTHDQAACRADCVATATTCIERIARIMHTARNAHRASHEAATGDAHDTRH